VGQLRDLLLKLECVASGGRFSGQRANVDALERQAPQGKRENGKYPKADYRHEDWSPLHNAGHPAKAPASSRVGSQWNAMPESAKQYGQQSIGRKNNIFLCFSVSLCDPVASVTSVPWNRKGRS
jgi:hypothetical protein